MNLSNALRTRRLFWVFLLGFLSCISAQVPQVSPKFPPPPLPHHPPHHPLPPQIKQIVDDLLRNNLLDAQLRNEEQPGFCALITQNFEEVYDSVGGASSIEKKRLIRKDTKFYIASDTKQFTAFAILKLVQDGLLKLSDTIQNRLLDSFPPKKYKGKEVPIMIKHLLAHTSGLINMPSDSDQLNLAAKAGGIIVDIAKENRIFSDQVLQRDALYQRFRKKFNQTVYEYYKNDPLEFEPGTMYSYSNYGYFLLGLIIERVSGMPYAQYLEENLFRKAHMHDTKVSRPQTFAYDKVASGYQKVGSVYKNMDSIALLLYTEIGFSAGNLISTVEDLNRWYQALFKYKIIDKGLLGKAQTPYTLNNGQTTGYGYGWIIDDRFGIENRIIWHNGELRGSFRSNVLFQPSSNTLAVLLSNFNSPLVCISENGQKYEIEAISFLSFYMLYYATGLINQPLEITILPNSECRAQRTSRALNDVDLTKVDPISIEGLINMIHIINNQMDPNK